MHVIRGGLHLPTLLRDRGRAGSQLGVELFRLSSVSIRGRRVLISTSEVRNCAVVIPRYPTLKPSSKYLRTMRSLLLLSLLLVQHVLCAQESVPELGRSSDQAQKVFDTRIASPRSSVAGRRIVELVDVDRVPVFPGGDDALRTALWNACDKGMRKAWATCNGDSAPFIRYVVDVDGRPTHGELINGSDCSGLEAALHCAMRTLPNFQPGQLAGIAVRTRVTLLLFDPE